MKSWGIYVIAILGYLGYTALTDADRDDSGAIVDAGNIDAFQIKVGDCFDDVGTVDEINSLPGVPCSEPHDNEAYAAFNVSLETYPGDEGMWDIAYEGCMEHFETFVGRDYETSSLDVFTLYPSAESFKQMDREVVCSIYDVNEKKLIGSAKGKGI